jgi:hypothetical protein
MNRPLRVFPVGVFGLLIALTPACADDTASPGAPGDGGGMPASQGARLAWSQAASSNIAVQRYSFILFVDGARTAFPGTACSGAPAPIDFECSGPLPALSPGRRVLEILAVDPGTGLESSRSAPLSIDVGSDGRPRASLGDGAVPDSVDATRPVLSPSTVCTTGTPPECFGVTVIAQDAGPVRRLLPLPDGRVVGLLEGGAVTVFPSGSSERPEFTSRDRGLAVTAVDVAADPDFAANRFLYFATTATAPDGRRTISVVRVRELAGRVGEPAAIVADLPAGPEGDPAIAIGPDRRIYLAMPGPIDDRTPFANHVLRFTPDGRADGNARNGSPVVAKGFARPSRLAWDSASRLLIASAEAGVMPGLAVVPVHADAVQWPAVLVSVAGPIGGLPTAGLSDLAAASHGGAADVAALARSGSSAPGVLRLAALTVTGAPGIASAHALPLGSLTPMAVAFARNGDLLVAAGDVTRTRGILVRLTRVPPAAPQ